MLSPILKTRETNKSANQIKLFSMEDSIVSEDLLNRTSKIGKIENESREIEELKQNVHDLKEEKKDFEWKIKNLNEKLLKCEEKSFEYYEMYHKLLLEVRANDDYKKKIEKQNFHIKNQLEILTRYLIKLEKKMILKNQDEEVCEFEINNWKHNFIVSTTQITTEDSEDELSQEASENFMNLPINLSILQESSDYSSTLRSKLTPSSPIDLSHQILSLKSQVLQ